MSLQAMISYQSADVEAVNVLHDEIALHGMEVIRDQASFVHGRRLDGEMDHAVETCDTFIIYLTPASLYLHTSDGGPRPAIDDEFVPAMQRRREHEAALRRADNFDPNAVRPVVIPVCHGLGDPRREAPDVVRQATGEDITSLWTLTVDQSTEQVTEADAANVAATTLRSLLPRGSHRDDGDALHVVVATRGTAAPSGFLSVDGTRLLGGVDRRPGDQRDWRRFLKALQRVEATLSAFGPARRVHFTLRAHLTAAIAAGRVFHQAASWRLSVDGRHGVVMPASSGDHADIMHQWDEGTRSSHVGMIEIDLLGHPVGAMAGALIRQLESAPRGRLQFHRRVSADMSPSDVAEIAFTIASTIRKTVAKKSLKVLHLLFAGPADVALLLGHQLTGMDVALHLYERDGDRYAPSLTLPASIR